MFINYSSSACAANMVLLQYALNNIFQLIILIQQKDESEAAVFRMHLLTPTPSLRQLWQP